MILSVEGSRVGVEGGQGGCRVEMLWRCYPDCFSFRGGWSRKKGGCMCVFGVIWISVSARHIERRLFLSDLFLCIESMV